MQQAAQTALALPDQYIQEAQRRRDFMIQGLGELGWRITPPKATMYLWVPCPAGMTAADFALNVLESTGVVFTPGSAFGSGGEGYVRASLIADEERLGEALGRLRKAGIRYQS